MANTSTMDMDNVKATDPISDSFSYREPIHFVIGKSQQHELWADASLFDRFANLRSRFLPKDLEQNNVVAVPELELLDFKVYLQMIHTGKIREHQHRGRTENTSLADYYVIAEALNDAKLKDRIIDAIIGKLGTPQEPTSAKPWFPSAEFVTTMYRGTKAGSHVRRLLVDIYIKEGSARWLRDGQAPWKGQVIWHPDFLMELAQALLECRSLNAEVAQAYKDPATGDVRSYRTKSCLYHHHREGEACGVMGG